MGHSPELSPEAKEIVKDAVREIVTPPKRSWESIAAAVCIIAFILTMPVAEANGTPFLLSRSVTRFVMDFVLLAFAAGLGWSAAQNKQRRGRILGATCFVMSVYLLWMWLYFLE